MSVLSHSLAPPCGGGGGNFTSENPNPILQPPDLLTKIRQRSFAMIAAIRPQQAVISAPDAASTISSLFIKKMIEGPLSGKVDSDAASVADVVALTATVSGNTTAINTKADGSALTTAEGTISTHAGQIVGLTNSFNNFGNSYYTKVLTDANRQL